MGGFSAGVRARRHFVSPTGSLRGMGGPWGERLVSFTIGIALAVVVVRVTALDRSRLVCDATGCGLVADTPARTDEATARRERDLRIYVMRAEAPLNRTEPSLTAPPEAGAVTAREPTAEAPAVEVPSAEVAAAAAPTAEAPAADAPTADAPAAEAPAAVAPEPVAVAAAADPPPPPTAGDEMAAFAPDLDGWWLVTNSVESTDHHPYENLRLTYRLSLRQEDGRIAGKGTTWEKNGIPLTPPQQTPVVVTGARRDGHVEVLLVENGRNVREGRIEWELSSDGQHLAGRFASAATHTTGRSDGSRETTPTPAKRPLARAR
jgi:hypothetical protein